MEKLFELSRKIYDNHIIGAVRKGLLLVFPLIIIGAFSLFLSNFPSNAYKEFMLNIFGANWKFIFQYIHSVSYGVVSIALVITIHFNLSAREQTEHNGLQIPVISAVVGLMCFFALAQDISKDKVYLLSSNGIFIAIFTSVLSFKIFMFLIKHFKKNFGYKSLDTDPVLSQALLAIIPALITVLFFCGLGFIILKTGFTDANQAFMFWVYWIFEKIKNCFFELVVFTLFVHILWFFGIHGNMMLLPVLENIYEGMPSEGLKLIDPGLANFTNYELLKTYLDVFVLVGGSGATICLMIAIFVSSRRTNTIKLARISLLPAILNINEIMIFGLPIVFNPIFLIPFLLGPVVMIVLSYLAIYTGIVPPVSQPVNWTTPPLLNAYIACGSIKGMMLQIFNILLGTAIYIPFVKAHEKHVRTRHDATYKQLVDVIIGKQYGTRFSLLSRNDSVGYLAGMLSKEITKAIKNDQFTLEYQPLIDDASGVIGFEALLRWPHERFGRISPLVVTAIAEESGSMNELGRWVVRKACGQLAQWNAEGLKGIRMSINISPTQMNDVLLTDELRTCISELGINASDVELEITENIAMDLDAKTKENIERLKSIGIRLAMDDFGMGYTSLLYIRHCNIDTIKIDGSITRDILKDKNCQDIVSSMVYLCNSMNIKVIAEYVEEAKQYELLKSLGCSEYQGYLFSPPLPPDQAARYMARMG